MYKFSLHKLSLSLSLATSCMLTTSCLGTSSSTNMQTEHEAPRREEVNYTKLEEYLSTTTENLSKARGKDFVLVLGNTDAGKSTLIKFLQGHYFELFEDMEEEERILRCTENPNITFPAPKLGDRFNACTLFPEIYNVTEDLLCCDTAGFGETRGLTEEILTYLGVQMAIKAARSVKAVVAVVEESQLTSQKGAGFKSIISAVLSLFRGDSYQPSFHLLVNKGTKSRTALLSTMAKMQASMGAMADKEKNETKAREYADLEAILAIFAKTGNVHPFRPYEQESRAYFLDLLQKSAPIPSDCLGMVRDSKYGQVVDRLLCDIAMEGLGYIRELHLTNSLLSDLLLEKRNASLHMEELKNLRLEQKSRIGEEQKEIEVRRESIFEEETRIEEKKSEFRATQERRPEIANEIARQNSLIEETQRALAEGRASVISAEQIRNIENENIARNTQVVETSNATIASHTSTITSQETRKTQLASSISSNQQTITAKQNTTIDSTNEVYPKVNEATRKQNELEAKRSQINTKKDEVAKQEQVLYRAQNDTSLVSLNSSCVYNEYALHGIVKKGVVKTEYIRAESGGFNVKEAKFVGHTGYVSEGTSGYFVGTPTVGWDFAGQLYKGPSHEYGWARVDLFGEKRYSADGISITKEEAKSLAGLKETLRTYQTQEATLTSEYNNAASALTTARNNKRAELDRDIQSCYSAIASLNQSIAEANAVIASSRNGIELTRAAKATAEGAITRSQANLQTIENTMQEGTFNTQRSEALLESRRASVASQEAQLREIVELLEGCRLAIASYESEIRNSRSAIDHSEEIIANYRSYIEDLESNLVNLEAKLGLLNTKFEQYIAKLGMAKNSLTALEQSKKVQMLEAICEIMQPKLEVVDEFRHLRTTLPGSLRDTEGLIEEIKSIE